MRRLLTATLLCAQLLSSAFAQKPQSVPPIPQATTPTQQTELKDDVDVVKITTNLVQFDAVITDLKGQKITDLRPDEVEMVQDGKPQKITNFSYVTLARNIENPSTLPGVKNAIPGPPVKLKPEEVGRAIALVVDDLGLSFDSTYYVRRSLKTFLDEQMRPNDLVAIIRSGGGVGALQQFTSDKRQLYAAIEKIKWNPWGRTSIPAFARIESGVTSARIDNSSVVAAGDFGRSAERDMEEFRDDLFAVGSLGALGYVVNGLKQLPGRKSIVLFSEGFKLYRTGNPMANVRMRASVRHLIDLANRSAVVINTIDARGLQTLGLSAADVTGDFSGQAEQEMVAKRRADFIDTQLSLDELSDATGGITIKNSNDLAAGLKRIVGDYDGYYLIGYRPDDSVFDRINGFPKFHNISLKIKRSGKFTVRMRNGFYGRADEDIAPLEQTPQQQLFGALLSPFSSSGIRLRLTSLFINKDKLGSAMHAILHVDARDLDFTKEADGSHKAVFDIAAVIFGDNGVPVERFNYIHTIRSREQNFARLMSNGFTYTMTVPIKKVGAYQLRTALRDQLSSRVGSASQFIEVPDVKKDKLLISGILLRGVPLETYMKGVGLDGAEQNTNDIEPDAVPYASAAIRQFKTGMALVYGFTIYNAQIQKTTGKPNLKIQARVFRNGQLVFSGDEMLLDSNGQTDLKRLGTGGGLQLGNTMTPGEYVLQIIVTDLAKEKPRVTSQWMDFEVIQ
jgi:VWFA-related protein